MSFQRRFEGSLIRILNCSKLILITHRCILRRLISSGLFGLVLITERLAWMDPKQWSGFGLARTRIMTSSSSPGNRTKPCSGRRDSVLLEVIFFFADRMLIARHS